MSGRGPEVCGTAEAVLLAMAGRFDAVHRELTGDGVDVVRAHRT
ncbi:hypothetical protein [Mycolicibacterium smegmatis]|nr:hypothetical protein [Mycolicibacterium smegmatis]UUR94459.1 hypothetical protein NQ424_22935 [Mycolicibacterium smegmatis]UUS01015.1 hypothetical protein NQ426_22930 [Mycolicibacterium smegmatis]UUS07570.1 hypothetical protein NQ427_22930 [Mycolicibacterium smegmatis]UUS17396.1 hypothetical protein NQ425_22930 [Mycolicibacterium smegmatis]UUS23950.1 hypothetical protein NQ423_22925 [Mycolicibacterium smegmatis]